MEDGTKIIFSSVRIPFISLFTTSSGSRVGPRLKAEVVVFRNTSPRAPLSSLLLGPRRHPATDWRPLAPPGAHTRYASNGHNKLMLTVLPRAEHPTDALGSRTGTSDSTAHPTPCMWFGKAVEDDPRPQDPEESCGRP